MMDREQSEDKQDKIYALKKDKNETRDKKWRVHYFFDIKYNGFYFLKSHNEKKKKDPFRRAIDRILGIRIPDLTPDVSLEAARISTINGFKFSIKKDSSFSSLIEEVKNIAAFYMSAKKIFKEYFLEKKAEFSIPIDNVFYNETKFNEYIKTKLKIFYETEEDVKDLMKSMDKKFKTNEVKDENSSFSSEGLTHSSASSEISSSLFPSDSNTTITSSSIASSLNASTMGFRLDYQDTEEDRLRKENAELKIMLEKERFEKNELIKKIDVIGQRFNSSSGLAHDSLDLNQRVLMENQAIEKENYEVLQKAVASLLSEDSENKKSNQELCHQIIKLLEIDSQQAKKDNYDVLQNAVLGLMSEYSDIRDCNKEMKETNRAMYELIVKLLAVKKKHEETIDLISDDNLKLKKQLKKYKKVHFFTDAKRQDRNVSRMEGEFSIEGIKGISFVTKTGLFSLTSDGRKRKGESRANNENEIKKQKTTAS